MPDIKDLLDREARQVEPSADWMRHTLVKVHRRRRAKGLGTTALSLMVAAGGLVLAIRAFDGSPSLVKDEAAGRDTYTLTNFEVSYPYQDPRSGMAPDASAAAVSFVTHWPASGYPGEADCQLILTGTDGETVGALDFGLDSLNDGGRGAAMEVPVSGPPLSADGSCTPGRVYESGPGYRFTGPTSVSGLLDPRTGEVIPNKTQLTFNVEWVNGDPGMRACSLVVTRTDGSQDAPFNFSTNIGPGPESYVVSGDPSTVRSARIRCGPIGG